MNEKITAVVIVVIIMLGLIGFVSMGYYFNQKEIHSCKIDCEALDYTMLEHKDYLFRDECYCRTDNESIKIW